MMEDMYNVMLRINELRNRFGLSGSGSRKVDAGTDVRDKNFDKLTMEAVNNYTGKKHLPGEKATREDIDGIIARYSDEKKVSPGLIRAIVMAESGYDPGAVSPKGALGLMQLMPSTADELGVTDPFDPEENIKGGVTFFKGLLDNYKGDYKMALAAYNSGKKTVDRNSSIPDYKETGDYVKKVIDYYVKDGGK